MTDEKYYDENCPNCKKAMVRRKRDLGKECKKCSMSKIGLAWGKKRKENPTKKTSAIYSKNYREKYKNDDKKRLQYLITQAKNRAKKRNLLFDIDVEFLLSIFPKDRKCPIYKIDLFWGNDGTNNREHSPSLDRLDSEKGYTKDNIKIISWAANRDKKHLSISQLEAILKYLKE